MVVVPEEEEEEEEPRGVRCEASMGVEEGEEEGEVADSRSIRRFTLTTTRATQVRF
tara:strand:+ start:323 stop:490 length:168 start_codon:yes stop_codon:yes gene_type:complete